MTDFKKNTQRAIDQALPGGEGAHALMLREAHTQTTHIETITASLDDLQQNNNLGIISTERDAFMMLFDWAYRDGKLGDTPEENLNALKEAYQLYSTPKYKNASATKAELTAHAIDRGITTISFDTRATLGETMLASIERGFSNNNILILSSRAKAIYDENPEYAQKLDAIESVIFDLRDANIPEDAASAHIIDLLADKNYNMITISGAGHLMGTRIDSIDTQGIIDESLLIAGWNVTDAFMGSESEITKINGTLENYHDMCHNYDHLDLFVNLTSDEVSKPTDKLSWAEYLNPFSNISVLEDTQYDYTEWHNALLSGSLNNNPNHVVYHSCTESPPVEKMFSPEELNPSLIPEISEALLEAQKTLTNSDEIAPPPASSSTTARER